ncbi:hypothetical protein SALWKB2_2295 [Snodgrassella alvi wkB2]|nr:hypothetical protein SALWKB2_2295 [Snodgrassella alvi wkB2]
MEYVLLNILILAKQFPVIKVIRTFYCTVQVEKNCIPG